MQHKVGGQMGINMNNDKTDEIKVQKTVETVPTKKKAGILKKVLLALLVVVIVSIGGFLIWASDYYHAEATVMAVVEDDDISLQEIDNLTVLSPKTPTDTGFIFYPGAKVEASAYLPILEKITETCNVKCILVEMPLNMAIFDADAADDVMQKVDGIDNWYISGHSMGGAMASSYASQNQDKVEGLVLMGAYIYGDYPPEKALTIYGTFNDNLEENMDYTENIVKIEGGNHAQFGNYGKQKGDPDATITADEQQDIAVEAIADFLKE